MHFSTCQVTPICTWRSQHRVLSVQVAASRANMSTDRGLVTLKKIGYAAAAVSSAGASIYVLSKALRKRKLGAIWSFDAHGAPPLAIQRQLQEAGYDSDGSGESDEEAERKAARQRFNQHEQQREELADKIKRAASRHDFSRVRELSGRLKELDSEAARPTGTKAERCLVKPHNNLVTQLEEKLQRAVTRQDWARVQELSQRIEELDQTAAGSSDDNSRLVPKRQKQDEESGSGAKITQQQTHEHNPQRVRRKNRLKASTTLYGRRQSHRSKEDSDESDLDEDATSSPVDGAALRQPERRTRHSAKGAGEQHGACAPREVADKNGGRKSQRPLVAAHPSAMQAIGSLQVGDIVKAECPCSGEWVDATVHELLHSSGLAVVRWHHPGVDARGRPFHPLGEVFADRVRPVFRKDSESGDAEEVVLPHNLHLGDACFAIGSHLNEKQWFQAKLLSTRSRCPQVRVEYVATVDGDISALRLPEPRKAFVDAECVQREPPCAPPRCNAQSASASTTSPAANTSPSCDSNSSGNAAPAKNALHKECKGSQGCQDDAIDPDLMCSICSRPDGESLMLICDNCKSGRHTYCLVPPLDAVPVDAWYCPDCQTQE